MYKVTGWWADGSSIDTTVRACAIAADWEDRFFADGAIVVVVEYTGEVPCIA